MYTKSLYIFLLEEYICCIILLIVAQSALASSKGKWSMCDFDYIYIVIIGFPCSYENTWDSR